VGEARRLMGVFCTVMDSEKKICPRCGKNISNKMDFIGWQTKDLSGEWTTWNVGDRITITNSGVVFNAEPFNAVWSGCTSCLNIDIDNKNMCGCPLECDIIIEAGIIKRIENIRKWKH